MSKDKQAHWFKHDMDAHEDEKIIKLMHSHKLEGFGAYWTLIQLLGKQDGYKLSLDLIPALAEKYFSTVELFDSVIKNFNLFENDGVFFWSDSLKRRMEKLDDISEKRAESGRKGGSVKQTEANAEQEQSNCQANDKQMLSKCLTENKQTQAKRKEQKRTEDIIKKEIIKEKFGTFENVLLTQDEYQKLKDKFNSRLPEMINNLSEYIASKGKKYNSHYATILNWERRAPTANSPPSEWHNR